MADQDNTPAPEQEAEAAAQAAEQYTETESTDSALEQLTQELMAAREQSLRIQAEMQNIRRRAEQDIEKAHKFGQEKLVADLLPVVDNLERALASIDTAEAVNKPIIEGIELTLKSFIDILLRHKVEAVVPVGEPFDPERHQAMAMVENPDVEPNTVIEVFQKGYTLHGRLVRPAMVVVSR